MIKLNLGCGGRILDGYLNIDLDPLETIKKRYPTYYFPPDKKIYRCDIFNLPFKNDSIDEVRADSLLEHLSFSEEPKLLYEVKRVLKVDGVFSFSVPDFNYIMEKWLKAKDNWEDFYRSDEDAIKNNHWFGQYSNTLDTKWGYLTACIFGPQNSEGQFHKNCYTFLKIEKMLEFIGFRLFAGYVDMWKNTDIQMLNIRAIKL